MKINVFTHILPENYSKALEKMGKPLFKDYLNARAPGLWDLDFRFRYMDKFEGMRDVLTLIRPAIESLVDRKSAVELAAIANDGLAELVAKYPDRFAAAVACLPMNDMDAALREAERAIKDLHIKGVQIYSSVNGKPLDSPEFLGLYDLMAEFDLPLWIHPEREYTVPDYVGETESKYQLYAGLGWPYETTKAMCRLVYSGLFDKHPNIKFITHHCGAMVPFFAHRLYELPRPGLKRPQIEYFKSFYGDTALKENAAALACGHAFFGTDHVLFGTDAPFRAAEGLEVSIKSVESLGLSEADKNKLYYKNAVTLLHLT